MDYLPDYYVVLGIDQDATQAQIEEAAGRLSRQFPEELRDPTTNIAYKQLVRAYEVLRNPLQRAAYDAQIKQTQSSVLNISLQASRDKIGVSKTSQLLYLLLSLHAPHVDSRERMPINLCLVFDRSTSMRGVRLEQVKIAAAQVVETLSHEDTISVVTFSDRAEVVVPAGRVNNKRLLLQRISQIQATGGTEIYQGLKQGVIELYKVNRSRHINRLILLTDGHTYGDDEECLMLAKNVSKKGVTFSAFGIGTDWNDRFLDQLVSSSGGHSSYIEDPDQIVKYLQEQVQGLGRIYATDIRLKSNFPEGMSCKYVLKMSPFAQPLDCQGDSIVLGDVEAHVPLSALIELEFTPRSSGTKIEIPLELTVTVPSQQIYNETVIRQHMLEIVSSAPRLSPSPMIVKAVQMLNLYRMNEKAWQDVHQGKLDMATKRMQRLSTRLLEAGQPDLAEQAMMETQRLSRLESVSPEGRKRLKYGTRSLITRTLGLRENDDSMS